jgi:glycosidase
MPITPIAQKNKKGVLGSYYAAADYTSINPEFGTIEDFKKLVQSAHQHGMKVILDWVPNHTGWDHRWTKEHPDWYEKDSATNDFKRASGMDDIIELDFKNPELRRAMIDAMKFWVNEADIDGFRCDLAFWVEMDFWLEAKPQVEAIKPLFWFGEVDVLENPDYMQVFDACYTWTWMHKAKDYYQNKLPISSLDSVLERYSSTPGIKSWFTTNHDENSWNGTEYEKYGEMAKGLAVFSCTWPGVPLIYSGQEMPNMKRLKFFEKDAIEWTGQYELHKFYKTLLNLRLNNPALSADTETASNYRITTSEDEKIFSFLRKSGEREVLVCLNLSPSKTTFNVNDTRVTGTFIEIFSGTSTDLNQSKTIEIQPWGFVVYEK